MSAKDDETEDMLSPMPPHIVPKREKTKSDMSRFAEEEMMGSLVRRRRIVSLPLGDRSFFIQGASRIDEHQNFQDERLSLRPKKQPSFDPSRNIVRGILRRKQISMDLMSPEQAAFFGAVEDEEEEGDMEDETDEALKKLFFPLRFAPRLGAKGREGAAAEERDEETTKAEVEAPPIVRATRRNKIQAIILACIMIALVGVCVGWKTHEDESHSLFGLSGIACVTNCLGDTTTRNFFVGNDDHFQDGDVIGLTMHLDPLPEEEDVFKRARVEIVRVDKDESGNSVQSIVKKIEFGPPDEHQRVTFKEKIIVEWENPEHRHVLNVYSETGDPLSFTLAATKQSALSRYSDRYASPRMEYIGSLVWNDVRLLVQSKGSFNRLMVLLCLLTAVASAFLDNVTTMLLVAPVTIDMCGILGVDPRPYLISEVILSNIGGTATLIGDPPNIIIGASFDEVGFLDFIINVMPCIFLFAVPVSLVLLLWVYKPYLIMKEMPELDEEKLKRTYPVYDEPRLLIAGTATFFLIVLFFLHPVHHIDTAWLALITAFLTISFTNPHDVQDVLRNHVEWDTLLFFAGLFVLVEVCADMGLLEAIGGALASVVKAQSDEKQLPIAITLILWVSAFTSAFLDNIPYTATMIPVVRILADELPETLPIKTLAWALSFGACLGGNGTLLGASANIVTAGISTNRGYKISFMNFFYPGMLAMIVTGAYN
eukprot:scaffold3055_cov228-Chaetoceros_neogracile.AAC.5